MPTILERLAALFSRDMRAVLHNPRAISMIENPSIRVQMAAIRRDKSVICFIDKPVEKYSSPQSGMHHTIFISSLRPVRRYNYPSSGINRATSVLFPTLRKKHN